MTDCSQRQAYTARLLEGEERRGFEAHLEACEACRRAVEETTALDARLRAWIDALPVLAPDERAARRLVREAERRAAPRAGWRWGLAAAAMAAIAAIALRGWPPGAPGPEGTASPATPPETRALSLRVLRAEGGAREPGTETALEVSGDGCLLVRANDDVLGLGAETRAAVLPTKHSHARVLLERGQLAVRAAHRGAGDSLSIEAGGYTVTVVGTRFSVAWDGHARLVVVVTEGRVRVVAPDGRAQMVGAGQRLRFGEDTAPGGAMGPASAEESDAVEQALREDEPAPTDPASETAGPAQENTTRAEPARTEPAVRDATIRQWLIDGDTERAERALRARIAGSPRDAMAWWLLGETRRRSGRPREAVEAYERVIALGRADEANRARYQAALLLEERLSDVDGALALYRAYLAASPRPVEAAAQLRLGRLLRARGESAWRGTLEDLVRMHAESPEAEQARRLLDTR
jgi:tetratricopeptide (TPR) repeat protein